MAFAENQDWGGEKDALASGKIINSLLERLDFYFNKLTILEELNQEKLYLEILYEVALLNERIKNIIREIETSKGGFSRFVLREERKRAKRGEEESLELPEGVQLSDEEKEILMSRIKNANSSYLDSRKTLIKVLLNFLSKNYDGKTFLKFSECISFARASMEGKKMGKTERSFKSAIYAENEFLQNNFGIKIVMHGAKFYVVLVDYTPTMNTSNSNDTLPSPAEEVGSDSFHPPEDESPYSLLEVDYNDRMIYESSVLPGVNGASRPSTFPNETELLPLVEPHNSDTSALKQYKLLLKSLSPKRGEIIVVKEGETPRVFYKVPEEEGVFYDRQ